MRFRPGARLKAEAVEPEHALGDVAGRREGRPRFNALMFAVGNREIDCVLRWKFDRFARNTRHLLAALKSSAISTVPLNGAVSAAQAG